MKAEDFLRSKAWKGFDDVLLKVAEVCEELKADPNYPAPAGDCLGVAIQLFLAEKFLDTHGRWRESLEPLIAEFRAADALATQMVNEESEDVH